MNKSRNFKPVLSNRMTGLSMVELLVAMVLGLGLAAGVIEVYTGNEGAERGREAAQRVQEYGRFALNYLGQEIHSAGHFGCHSSNQGLNLNIGLDSPPAHFQPETGLQGWEANGTDPGDIFNSLDAISTVSSAGGGWSTSGTNTLPTLQVMPGSDIVRTWNTSGEISRVNSVTNGANPSINISSMNIAVGDILILNDCEHIDIVQACSISNGASGTLNVGLGDTCSPGNRTNLTVTTNVGAEATKLEGTVIYVGKRNNTAANPPSLMRARLNASASPAVVEELVPGVESMQLLYGINSDQDDRNTVDTYLPADQIAAGDWGRVISVRASLLLQSEVDSVTSTPQAYQFNGSTYDGSGGNGNLPQDTRIRRSFISTLSLRNRALGL
ncbi:MAG: PilW family protein [Gammaproteobacteria bacterium]|nr:PilW family protein [Pseudomonadales bacterium]MCP5345671.1 PilW family protein [Pseudomonadales bacterium]